MKKLLSWSENLLTYAAVVATAIMVLLTSADAILRYLFNRPITGAYEVTEKYLMLASVFLGCAYSYRRGAFIRVTILTNHLRRSVMIVINHCVQLFSIFYIIVLTIATILQVLRTYASKMTFNTMSQPVWPSCAIIPAGLFLMLVLMVLDLRRVRKGESALFKDDSPTI
jgi:TRAP-type C4-dicarboxylate transport system permease small subunit